MVGWLLSKIEIENLKIEQAIYIKKYWHSMITIILKAGLTCTVFFLSVFHSKANVHVSEIKYFLGNEKINFSFTYHMLVL